MQLVGHAEKFMLQSKFELRLLTIIWPSLLKAIPEGHQRF